MSLLYVVNVTKNPIRLDLGGVVSPNTRTVKAHGANKYTKLKEDYTAREHDGALYIFDKDEKEAKIKSFFNKLEAPKKPKKENESEVLATIYHEFIKDFKEEKKELIEDFEKAKEELIESVEKQKEESNTFPKEELQEIRKEFEKAKEELTKDFNKEKQEIVNFFEKEKEEFFKELEKQKKEILFKSVSIPKNKVENKKQPLRLGKDADKGKDV